MIVRLACLLGLIALAALVLLLVRLDGETATVFSFVGFPSLGLALVLYAFVRWRAGAFRVDHPTEH
jgi:hypothetical protein